MTIKRCSSYFAVLVLAALFIALAPRYAFATDSPLELDQALLERVERAHNRSVTLGHVAGGLALFTTAAAGVVANDPTHEAAVALAACGIALGVTNLAWVLSQSRTNDGLGHRTRMGGRITLAVLSILGSLTTPGAEHSEVAIGYGVTHVLLTGVNFLHQRGLNGRVARGRGLGEVSWNVGLTPTGDGAPVLLSGRW